MNVSSLIRGQGRIEYLCLAAAVAGVLSACSTRTYYEVPPAMPFAVEPAAGTTIINGTPVQFVWRASDTAEHYDFHIFDRTTSDIQKYYRKALKPASHCAANICSLTITVFMPADKGHAWRVRAYNSAGNSTWSRSVFQVKP